MDILEEMSLTLPGRKATNQDRLEPKPCLHILSIFSCISFNVVGYFIRIFSTLNFFEKYFRIFFTSLVKTVSALIASTLTA